MKEELDFSDFLKEKHNWKQYIPAGIVIVVIVILLIVIVASNGKKNALDTEALGVTEVSDTEDPELKLNGMTVDSTEGSDVEVVDAAQILTASEENSQTTIGIDVSKYQGTIDWSSVASTGIDFAMIRVGYRATKTGVICEDTNAKYNMQQAAANGIQVGVYFFSSAINKAEAIEEADWVADYIAQYAITYPVAFDCENYDSSDSRQYGLTQTTRTQLAEAFMDEIYSKGYTPMFYAAANTLKNNAKWDTEDLELTYKMWVAQYPDTPYPETASSSYTGQCAMWQYTNQASVTGISGSVDLNVAYFGYDSSASAQDSSDPGTASADVEANMTFTEMSDTVTAKDQVNLRDIPSQDTDASIIATISNGETLTRTGISTSGWSRLDYNGTTCYAVTSYLTTDLTTTDDSSDGATDMVISGSTVQTKFTDCSDSVTAKIEVNLRTLPSVTNENSQVVYTLPNGEYVTRTGYNSDYGWSRVEYNGQTLYCITSYLTQ